MSDLMPEPAVGDLRSASVSQHVVLHALHTGVLSHFGSVRRLVVLHLCKHKHSPRIRHALQIITWVSSAENILCLGHVVCVVMFLSFAALLGRYTMITRCRWVGQVLHDRKTSTQWDSESKTNFKEEERVKQVACWVNVARIYKSILVWGHSIPNH